METFILLLIIRSKMYKLWCIILNENYLYVNFDENITIKKLIYMYKISDIPWKNIIIFGRFILLAKAVSGRNWGDIRDLLEKVRFYKDFRGHLFIYNEKFERSNGKIDPDLIAPPMWKRARNLQN